MKIEKKLKKSVVIPPLTVPQKVSKLYCDNYDKATRGTGKLFLFAGDQKLEHLHDDFYGSGIPEECGDPKHLFSIAAGAPIGVFAAQLGLIARYGKAYKDRINYVIKLNGKTNLISTSQKDPQSLCLTTVEQVVAFTKETKLSVVGVGYTLYLGSEYEAQALQEAAQIIYQAHQVGLLVVLWIYPRGKAVKDEKAYKLIAGAAGVGTALGADFVKINPPSSCDGKTSEELLRVAVHAAGNTGIICSGGNLKNEQDFLQQLYDQIHTAGVIGCAIGRNIHQRPLKQALAFAHAVADIIFCDASVTRSLLHLKK